MHINALRDVVIYIIRCLRRHNRNEWDDASITMMITELLPKLSNRWTWKELGRTYYYAGVMVYRQRDNLGMVIVEEELFFLSPLALFDEVFYRSCVN